MRRSLSAAVVLDSVSVLVTMSEVASGKVKGR